jgi:hypothetical protein
MKKILQTAAYKLTRDREQCPTAPEQSPPPCGPGEATADNFTPFEGPPGAQSGASALQPPPILGLPLAVSRVANSQRGPAQPVLVHKGYDYVPSILYENGHYRMWWGGAIAGDFILYAQAQTLNGPWRGRDGVSPFDISLQPTNNHVTDGFDAQHTCDPSVVRVGGSYYLYYGGLGYNSPFDMTQVGVAVSSDGYRFTRLNKGQAIIEPARLQTLNRYGAGQPSVFYYAHQFYLAYTDTTGQGSNSVNGSGIYALRCAEPTFQQGVEELGPQGFATHTANLATHFPLIQAFSVDWMYIPSLQMIGMATALDNRGANLHFWDLKGRSSANDLAITTPTQERFAEGPGLVRDPSGHALQLDAMTLRVDIVQAIFDHSGDTSPNAWDLGTYGSDIRFSHDLTGSLLVSPNLPLALLTPQDGRVQFDSWEIARCFGKRTLQVPAAYYLQLPGQGTVLRSGRVIGAQGRPAAFVDPDKVTLHPTDCAAPLQYTGGIETVPTATFDSFKVGVALRCVVSEELPA